MLLRGPWCIRRHALGAAKGAQAAVGHAYVGRIDMAVHVEVGDVAMHPLAHMVGQPADGQDVTGAIERYAISKVRRSSAKTSSRWPRCVDRSFGKRAALCLSLPAYQTPSIEMILEPVLRGSVIYFAGSISTPSCQ